MREIRPSSLEGGVRLIPHPYPYRRIQGEFIADPNGLVENDL